MNIEMISTGDEVLTGFINDTNATFLAEKLLELNIKMTRRSTVGDNLKDLIKIFEERSNYADIIVVNGGLGPTSDDLSAQAIGEVLNEPLELNEEAYQHLKSWFEARDRVMAPNNVKQAMLPKSAVIIPNPNGTACGFFVTHNNAIIIFTPGVPSEYKSMIENYVLPLIKEHPLFVSKCNETVKRYFIFGIGESNIAHLLEQKKFPSSITLGYRVDFPFIELKLIAENASLDEINIAEKTLLEVADKYLVSKNDFTFFEDLPHEINNQQLVIKDESNLNLDFYDVTKHLKKYIIISSNSNISNNFLSGCDIIQISIKNLKIDNDERKIFEILIEDFSKKTSLKRCFILNTTKNSLRVQLATLSLDLLRRFTKNQDPNIIYDNIKNY
ncbi:MAG: CinA family nicotinamide mononucleotide deamidase-related protein [Succinivibrionaceae bacterium]|nr:CinA family nicotinamide mononucleotide deamidase-related protein [Succinivibrionaceae bacterium]